MSRESAMARLAAARGYAVRIVNAIDDTIDLFIDSSEDPNKHERSMLLDAVVEDSGQLSRVVEEIQDEGFDFADPLNLEDDGEAEEEVEDE